MLLCTEWHHDFKSHRQDLRWGPSASWSAAANKLGQQTGATNWGSRQAHMQEDRPSVRVERWRGQWDLQVTTAGKKGSPALGRESNSSCHRIKPWAICPDPQLSLLKTECWSRILLKSPSFWTVLQCYNPTIHKVSIPQQISNFLAETTGWRCLGFSWQKPNSRQNPKVLQHSMHRTQSENRVFSTTEIKL